MRKYKVIVDGTAYEVGVELLSGAPEAAAAPAPAPAQPAPAAAAGEVIRSPMPGNILSVNVQPGNAVKEGQVLMVLEALKMENEIICPRDGVVGAVHVQAGASVETDTPLCTLQ
ncbi:MAG: biotin/lipoyl-binding protein [Clostridiales bacterium]|nr:biotin/lipoyl-binding protein [Clostridiales bacterium]